MAQETAVNLIGMLLGMGVVHLAEGVPSHQKHQLRGNAVSGFARGNHPHMKHTGSAHDCVRSGVFAIKASTKL